MALQFAAGIFSAFRMPIIIGLHVSVTVEANGNAVVVGIFSVICSLFNVVQFDLAPAELMADTTVATTV